MANKKIINLIKRLVVKAAMANEEAHACERHERNRRQKLFDEKEKYYSQAIKIINGLRHCPVRYFIQKTDDQNGYPSIIHYFQWMEKGTLIQFSFHKPINNGRSVIEKGRKILWSGIHNKEVLAICERLGCIKRTKTINIVDDECGITVCASTIDIY